MSEELLNLSAAIAALTAAAGQSVVTVNGRRRSPASGVVWSPEGHIVTANHVVERDDNVTIITPQGEERTVEIAGRDAAIDIALLRIAGEEIPADLKPPRWAAAGELQVGQLALAVARPNGSIEASLGTISSLGGPWRHRSGGRFDLYLRPDLTMYPGFSGGPLLTAGGAFAGINSSALARGANLTVPTATIQKSVEALLMHGHVPRAYLGVGVQPVHLQPAQVKAQGAGERSSSTALMIMSVEPETPASEAGLLQGDILLALDEHELGTADDLQVMLGEISAPAVASLQILRGGAIQEVEVQLIVREL